jgi:predicted phage terminase large subunit-like protein
MSQALSSHAIVDQDYGDFSNMIDENTQIVKPQDGPQTAFVQTDADIAIYGGQAGGGKSWSLMFLPLAYIDIKGFEALIFRRTAAEIKGAGSLWDKSFELYGLMDSAEPRVSDLQWRFHENHRKKNVVAKVTFGHMEHEKDKHKYQGTEVPFIGFDELTHFTKTQFLYMFSRNRSTTGIPGRIRATCNPDPDSFVAELIDWWIDDEGYAIKERSGVIRYMITERGEQFQYNTMAELKRDWAERFQDEVDKRGVSIDEVLKDYVKTVTFIPASLDDNQILLEKDPSYKASLNALPYVEQRRLREGNWRVRASAGAYFKPEFFEVVKAAPVKVRKRVRYWDRAATAVSKKNKAPDFTVGLKMSLGLDGILYIEDMVRFQENPTTVVNNIRNTATQDGKSTLIYLEQEPGASGKSEVQSLIRELHGYSAYAVPKRKATEELVRPLSAQAGAGNVKIVEGMWNKPFFSEMENYPMGLNDDIVVSAIGGHDVLIGTKKIRRWGAG